MSFFASVGVSLYGAGCACNLGGIVLMGNYGFGGNLKTGEKWVYG